MSGLRGRIALVTGAASGIGAATAEALAAAGAHVVAADRADAGPVAARLTGLGAAGAEAAVVDVADEASVAGLFASLAPRPPDIVVNAAGVLLEGGLQEMAMADFDRQIAINLRGAFLIARGAAGAMGPGGRLILIASELAHQGRAGASGYCASKAGVIGLVRALARELAPEILVNAVAPGPTDTPMLDFANMPPAAAAAETANPLGRIARPQEIADAVLYLAGPGASFMTGQTICPSGGAVML